MAKIVTLASPDGKIITLDRIARITDGFTEDPRSRARINGDLSVMLIVYKTRARRQPGDLPGRPALRGRGRRAPAGGAPNSPFSTTTPKCCAPASTCWSKNGIIGLVIVFILLWMFLNARLSLWAGMGIPISVAGALVILWALGGSLNMISLFGFIMVLGIVVDDAIVVGEAIYFHRKAGQPPLTAAVAGVGEVGDAGESPRSPQPWSPFVPLAFVGGIMGKFIAVLPTVVIACLAVSPAGMPVSAAGAPQSPCRI